MTLRSAVIFASLLTVALVAACGGSDDGASDPEADYREAVRAISERRDEALEALDTALDQRTPEAAMAVLAAELPAVIASLERAARELEQLVPPAQYAEDQARFIEIARERVAVWQSIVEAAEARDFTLAGQLRASLDELARAGAAALSPEFLELVLVSEADVEFSLAFGDLEEEEIAYTDGLAAGILEFSKRVAVFGQRFSQQYANSEALLEALDGAGAGTAFEAARDVIVALEPPDSFRAEHERVLQYLDEAVRLDREIGRSIEERDIVLFVVSNIGLGRNGDHAALDLDPAICRAMRLNPRLCGLSIAETTGSAYGDAVRAALAEFNAGFGSDGRFLDLVENLISDDDMLRLVETTHPELKLFVTDARGALSLLSPPSEFQADHERIIAFFDSTLETLGGNERAASAFDRAAVLDGGRQLDALRREAGADLSEPFSELVRSHFAGS